MASENIIMAMVKAGADRQVYLHHEFEALSNESNCNCIFMRLEGPEQIG